VSRRHKPGQHDRKRRWTVLTPGSGTVPAQAWTFRERKRARRLAGNIRGARVSGPRRPRGLLWWFGLLLAVMVLLAGLGVLSGGGR
jgi:hypothetical protein